MMPALRFIQVDAFADRAFAGNPAAVMLLDDWLDDRLLQAIAAENNLAETAFLVPHGGGEADFDLRWFTPVAEVALCGHATLASGHVILSDDSARDDVRFATRQAGILTVRRGRTGYALDLPAWPASPQALPEKLIAQVGGQPVETLWHDKGYAVLVYADERMVRALRPDFAALAGAGNLLIIATAPGERTDVVSRAFAPAKGVNEDPVTGSAHAVIAPYWAARLGRAEFTAHQASARGGNLNCRLVGDRVVLGGGCVTVIEGRFYL
jgi:predicted PhzF superfamily epimerase YddE/YHI9